MAEPIRERPVRTTVFMSGNSQAVRIPAALRFDTDSVMIERLPEGLLLRPEGESFGHVVARLREFQRANGIEPGLVEEVEDLPEDFPPDLDGGAQR
ncbi:MAG: AbrB/MazE/SpoVT family DNA-binding domain-containing protein [Staphylococcus hominis]|uniref:antitoxin n=1 Tax=Corynebacterium afermentans TaxID=38286 RepID=UPI001205CDFE|nr:AbrB/MazE/SpoVT family DNA-binding domain-containing protein [Corynebacterium afermentans]MBF4548567.1 AbrB/MazE/SpoVT family DNA-binding domain-containing protein [Corynebacterium afermentans subsp. lipophilum]TKW70213.1 MAG: AbrB/MazE/SpoVT family DNA-binding domain-containing protein [Staphylococcus hominis]WJY59858.1 Antitoxin VapB1 [Corynebacterium afermentans subsp. lipophilum]